MQRSKLDKIGRANPTQWGHFTTATTVVKIIRNNHPHQLFTSLSRNVYQERRKPSRLRFFNDSNKKVGLNCLRNRLTEIFNAIDFDHYPNISDEGLRTNLKRLLF